MTGGRKMLEALNYGAALRRALHSQTDDEVDRLVKLLPAKFRRLADEAVAAFRADRVRPYGVRVCFDCDEGATSRRPLFWDPKRESFYHRSCGRPGARLESIPAEPNSAEPVRTARARRVRTREVLVDVADTTPTSDRGAA